MRHLKTVMIIAVLLMVLGFSVSVLFGMWCIYDEGIRENQKIEVNVEETVVYGKKL